MLSVQPCSLPEGAFLRAYADEGAYTDCFVTEVQLSVSQARYVQSFYTTPAFKLERLILKMAVSRPSTDEDAQALAQGTTTRFSAWDVERRDDSQILLRDFTGRTRSWLMATPGSGATTRLHFGSAVVPRAKEAAYGVHRRPPLLAFHRLYSAILLNAARSRLQNGAS
jgi:hypothetical protein